MWVCCYCFNRRKWVLAEEEFLGSQLTKKEKKLVVITVIHASPFLLVSGWVNILSHWPASCFWWFRETKAWLIKWSKMITWRGYYLLILINPTIGSDRNIRVFLQSNTINAITILSMKYSESKWKEKKYLNSNERGEFLQRLFAVELTVLKTSDLERRRKSPQAAVQTRTESEQDWGWALHSRVDLENCDSHLLMYDMMPNAGMYDMQCANVYRLCAGINHFWISLLVCPFFIHLYSYYQDESLNFLTIK